MLSTAEGRGCVNITIISDDRVEGLETFVVRTDLDAESISTTVNVIDSGKCKGGKLCMEKTLDYTQCASMITL